MSKKDWMGKIAIHVDSRTGEPLVVYIDDSATAGKFFAHIVNGNEMYLVSEADLIEFSFITFRKMRSSWKLKDLKRQVQSIELRNSLDELKANTIERGEL